MPRPRAQVESPRIMPQAIQPLLKGSIRLFSTLAVTHIACWVASVVIGIAAIWTRLQFTQGWEHTFFGTVGLSIWSSFTFIICGVLSIAVMKTESRRLISWYMLFAGLAFLFALSIFAFSVVAMVNEASIEVIPKRLVIAGITASVSMVELLASIGSFIICFRSIGFTLQFRSKKHKSGLVKNRIRPFPPMDQDPGLVTVMALPPREAADLFMTLYKPYMNAKHFITSDGLAFGENFNHLADPGFWSEQRRYTPPDDRRKHRRKHFRRPIGRVESPEDLQGFHSEANDFNDEDEIENDWNATTTAQHSRIHKSHGKSHSDDSQSPTRNRFATVPENNIDNTRKKENQTSTKTPKEETEKKTKTSEKKP